MDILNNEVPVSAPVIQSFGLGGQAYIYDMETGFMVTAERTNPIFDFAATDKGVANAEFLTNLTEARKIGSTMAVKAVQIGFRVNKVDGSECSPAEVAAMKALLASARVKLTYGSNDTVVGEFSGQHVMGAVDNLCSDTTATAMSQAGNNNCTAWINLPVPSSNTAAKGYPAGGGHLPPAIFQTKYKTKLCVLFGKFKKVKP